MSKRAVISMAAAGALVLSVQGGPAVAQGAPTQLAASPADRMAELLKLGEQASKLEKEYGADLRELKEGQKDAAKATKNAKEVEKKLTIARANLANLAHATYIGGDVDQAMFSAIGGGDDLTKVLGRAATVDEVAHVKNAEIQSIQQLADDAAKAAKAADNEIKKLKNSIKDLEKRRGKVKKLLSRYGAKQPINTAGNTPRMQRTLDEVLARYPNQYTTGCVRSGDGGDHGSGRACDFMVTSGGAAASGVNREFGNKIAEYAIKNSKRLGVKYVIWLQRIYDMRRPGWRMMGNRGSNTQNHMDHVHISVF